MAIINGINLIRRLVSGIETRNLIQADPKYKLDLAFNNVKPKDCYFVLDLAQVWTELGCVRLTNQNFGWMDQGHHSWYPYPSKS